MSLMKSGFTLIEVMIVCALCALGVTVAISVHSLFCQMSLKAEHEQLYAMCLYAQQKAMATGHEQTLALCEEGKQCYTSDGETHLLSRDICFGVIAGVKGPPSSPSKELKRSITFKNRCITFYPDGIIDAGTVYLTDKNHAYLYAISSGVATASCLRRYRYENGWKSIGD